MEGGVSPGNPSDLASPCVKSSGVAMPKAEAQPPASAAGKSDGGTGMDVGSAVCRKAASAHAAASSAPGNGPVAAPGKPSGGPPT